MAARSDSRQRADDESRNDPTDQQVVVLLEAYEEQLLHGTAAPVTEWLPEDLPPEVSQRLRRACEVLVTFDRARRISVAGLPNPDDAANIVEGAAFKRLGRFEMIRELGRGAFGIVFLANDSVLRRQVALKVPRPEALLTPDSRRRFQREAQAAARLTHPNLIPVYETGEAGPICYIAAMYCEGPTLSSWLSEQTKPVSATVGAEIVAQLADGVAYAHSQGILHRDIKPTNVLLEPTKGMTLPPEFAANAAAVSETLNFTPKLTDFGLAKIEELSCGETRTGAVMGTPAYMAPEQAAGRSSEIGPAADVYALGTLLYEILTRQAPFVGASDAGILHQVISIEPTALHKIRRDVPADLEAICLKCLEKNSAARYASCAALADDLRRFIHGEPTRARPLSRAQRLRKWTRRNPATAALVVVSCLAALTIAGGSGAFSWRLAASLQDSEERRVEAVAARTEAEQHQANALRERDANAEFLYAARMRQAFQGVAQGDGKQVTDLLAAYDEGMPYAGLRGFEWQYIKRSLQGERLTLTGHKGEVYSVAFSPDGRFLASAAEDGQIKLWDPSSGQELRTIAAHTNCANDLSFSPDGRRLASASCDRTVKVWDTSTWREVSSFSPGARSVMTNVSFSPDGRLLAAGDNDAGTVTILEAATGKLVTSLEAAGFESVKTRGIDTVAWSPDGRLLAAATIFGGTHLWETDDWQKVHLLPAASAVAFSPDSTLVAIHTENVYGGLQLWDADSGERLSTVVASLGRVHRIGFGANGRQLFACGSDGTVKTWTLTGDGRGAVTISPTAARTLLGHSERVQAFTIAPDGHSLATASFDGTVRLWDLAAPGGAVPMLSCPATTTSLSADLDILTAVSRDRRLATWDVLSGKSIDDRAIAEIPEWLDFYLSPDGESLYALSPTDHIPQMFLGETRRPAQLRPVPVHAGAVVRAVFSRDGRFIASVGDDGFIRVWNTQTGKERFALESPQSSANDTHSFASTVPLSLSADGGLLLTIESAQSCIIDLETGTRVAILSGADAASVLHAAFSLDSRLLAVLRKDGSASVVDCTTGKTLQTVRLPGACGSLAFSPDGRTLATGIEIGLVILWHVATGQELARLPTQVGPVSTLQFSTDGRALAAVVIAYNANASLYMWSGH